MIITIKHHSSNLHLVSDDGNSCCCSVLSVGRIKMSVTPPRAPVPVRVAQPLPCPRKEGLVPSISPPCWKYLPKTLQHPWAALRKAHLFSSALPQRRFEPYHHQILLRWTSSTRELNGHPTGAPREGRGETPPRPPGRRWRARASAPAQIPNARSFWPGKIMQRPPPPASLWSSSVQPGGAGCRRSALQGMQRRTRRQRRRPRRSAGAPRCRHPHRRRTGPAGRDSPARAADGCSSPQERFQLRKMLPATPRLVGAEGRGQRSLSTHPSVQPAPPGSPPPCPGQRCRALAQRLPGFHSGSSVPGCVGWGGHRGTPLPRFSSAFKNRHDSKLQFWVRVVPIRPLTFSRQFKHLMCAVSLCV